MTCRVDGVRRARPRSADVDVRWVCTTITTTTSDDDERPPPTMPPSTVRRRRCGARPGGGLGGAPRRDPLAGRPRLRRRTSAGTAATPLSRGAVTVPPRASRDAGHRASARATSSSADVAERSRADTRSAPRRPGRRCRSSRSRSAGRGPTPSRRAARNTTSSTAAAIAAVRTNTPSSSASPTAISTTGSPNATGRDQRLGQQPVGAHGAHGGRRIGHLQHPGDDEDAAEHEPGGRRQPGRQQPTSDRIRHVSAPTRRRPEYFPGAALWSRR